MLEDSVTSVVILICDVPAVIAEKLLLTPAWTITKALATPVVTAWLRLLALPFWVEALVSIGLEVSSPEKMANQPDICGKLPDGAAVTVMTSLDKLEPTLA